MTYIARKEENAARIIQAATREFLNKGLDAASMHNIAETAEVSKRTLYKYFPSKGELYDALVNELLDRVHDMYQPRYSTETPIRRQLEVIVENRIRTVTSESFLDMSRIVIGELLKTKTPTRDQLTRMDNSEILFVQWVDDARNDGRISSALASDVIAEQLHSIIKGQVFFPVLLGSVDVQTVNTQDVRDTTVAFFLNAYCA